MEASTDTANLPPPFARIAIDVLGIVIALAICAWVARSALQTRTGSGGFATPKEMAPCLLDKAGYLNGRLYGTIDRELDWRGPNMDCDGMLRPNDGGIRVFFSASEPNTEERLVFVIGIEGSTEEIGGQEGIANITIIDEVTGNFFSTGGKERCWSTVSSVTPLPDKSGQSYNIAGDLYCVGALPALNGSGSVTLGDFSYSGRLAIDDE